MLVGSDLMILMQEKKHMQMANTHNYICIVKNRDEYNQNLEKITIKRPKLMSVLETDITFLSIKY